jgi:drug/metabolite transporter (DMT)-like permease
MPMPTPTKAVNRTIVIKLIANPTVGFFPRSYYTINGPSVLTTFSNQSYRLIWLAVIRSITMSVPAAYATVIMLWVFKINFPWTRESKQVYMLSAFGIVTGMSLGYFAAQYISSGLMSLIFGLLPLVSSYLGQRILGEAKLSRVQKSAMLLALLGLIIVCSEKIELNPESYKGILLVLASVVFLVSVGC